MDGSPSDRWPPRLAPDAQVASCLRKVRHRTEAKALVVAARCAAKREVKGLHAYRCPVCDGWHLTHQQRRRAPEDEAWT